MEIASETVSGTGPASRPAAARRPCSAALRGTRRPSASSRRGWESTSRTSPCRAMAPESSTQSVLQCAVRSESFCSATTMVTPRALSAERRRRPLRSSRGRARPWARPAPGPAGAWRAPRRWRPSAFARRKGCPGCGGAGPRCPPPKAPRGCGRPAPLRHAEVLQGKEQLVLHQGGDHLRVDVLEHGADDAAQVRGRVLDRVQAADAAGAVEVAGPVVGHRAAQHGEQRGLARAGGAENPQKAAPRHPEREGAQRGLSAPA